ncbi:hypothetical protein BB561_002056 [Smittium simulii]|uniref:Thioredoxin domain-containing protein n=1 Tax=Smittium simulii TaxID=133385 RepID=A0A2T9YRV5_9FUNG|nr:hypothetical protein BB561_002056 [Smittium simulii]
MSKDLDDSFDELDFLEDDEYERIIAQRKHAMKQEYDRVTSLKSMGYLEYKEILQEKELMNLITKTEKIVVHYFHPNFKACKILDTHLEKLSQKILSARFVKANAENLPWLSKKINLRVLPCLVVYDRANVVDKLIGFDELGKGDDNFQTSSLEKWLDKTGIS